MADDDKKLTVGGLKKMIQDIVAEVVPDTPPAKNDKEETVSESTMASRVKAEIEKIRAREAAEERDKRIDSELIRLAKDREEKPPVERRFVHKLMGWGE